MSIITNLSRRDILKGVTVVGAAGLAVACGAPAKTEPKVEDPDVSTLNALLSAEHDAILAYSAGAPALMGSYLKVAVHFQDDHKAHRDLLASTIETLGGTPVASPAQFTAPAGFTATFENVIRLAANAEREAAIAYNQVLMSLKDTNNQLIAAAISSDETQHFIVLTGLLLGVIEPGAALGGNENDVAPRPFVTASGTVSGKGLESEPSLRLFTAGSIL